MSLQQTYAYFVCVGAAVSKGVNICASLCVCHLLSLVCAQQEVGVAKEAAQHSQTDQTSFPVPFTFTTPVIIKITAQQHFPSPLLI